MVSPTGAEKGSERWASTPALWQQVAFVLGGFAHSSWQPSGHTASSVFLTPLGLVLSPMPDTADQRGSCRPEASLRSLPSLGPGLSRCRCLQLCTEPAVGSPLSPAHREGLPGSTWCPSPQQAVTHSLSEKSYSIRENPRSCSSPRSPRGASPGPGHAANNRRAGLAPSRHLPRGGHPRCRKEAA